MARHMKTTLEIPEPLLKEAKAVARRDGLTFRALVERGLHLALSERRKRKPFRMRNASVGGAGLQPEAQSLTWGQVLKLGYEGRAAG
jgi:hypothetical protein